MNDHRDIAVVQKIILRPYRLIDLFLFYVIDKICWGCDTWTVEESYGSLLAFRFSLCKVLSEKIADGYLSVNNAKDIINKILFDNAPNIYF